MEDPNQTKTAVLLVDDNPTNLKVLFQTLAPEFNDSCQLLIAKSGEEAIETAMQVRPSLILLDIMMPGIDGYETCRRIKSDPQLSDSAVIFMSALNETKNKVRGLEVGAIDYITKPFQTEEVIARVKTHLKIQKLTEDLQKKNQELIRINQRMKRDLDAAARIQQILLPSSNPRIDGCQFAWEYVPCDELAGDSLNIIPIDERFTVAYVLDVSGHGVPASLLSVAVTRSLMPNPTEECLILKYDSATKTWLPKDPCQVAANLNQIFPMEQNGMNFFSIIYGVFDRQLSHLDLVCAGHPGPIKIRADGSCQAYEFCGYLIGVTEEATFETQRIPIETGDRIYFHSDGLVEQTDQQLNPFTVERLAKLLQESRQQTLSESTGHVIESLKQWTGNRNFNDDISLLGFERTD